MINGLEVQLILNIVVCTIPHERKTVGARFRHGLNHGEILTGKLTLHNRPPRDDCCWRLSGRMGVATPTIFEHLG
jgi:hypothetical protein